MTLSINKRMEQQKKKKSKLTHSDEKPRDRSCPVQVRPGSRARPLLQALG